MSRGRGTKRTRGKKKPETLTRRLSKVLAGTLLPDLRKRVATEPAVAEALAARWAQERRQHRTGAKQPAWIDEHLEQVGAAWALSCVFLRTLEDRELVGRRRLAGPGAADSERLFFTLFPHLGLRDYLRTAFREVARLPGAEALLGRPHNLAFRLAPTEEAVRALLAALRQDDEDRTPHFRFGGPGDVADTRFLGDLYQDLSEPVRKRYALLQTPRFVETFILERTLDPAIEAFGLDTVRLIDPACGSGHFLLGAFERLFQRHLADRPGLDRKEAALRALAQVHGVDVNPFAVAIARFRLTCAFLAATGSQRLSEAPQLPANVVVADSLYHGTKAEQLRLADLAGDDEAWRDPWALEDEAGGRRVLGQRYHAVVGNPPYITCKDPARRDTYRDCYDSAAGRFSLSAPFAERIFELAVQSGYTGQITANSFMKREFGRSLIERVLPRYDLTYVVDTSGAYIPGHGTPTVLLFGRNASPVGDSVLAVLGKRGEPSTPEDPAEGLVWASIRDHGADIGHDDDFVTVAALPATTLRTHPWTLSGGGAALLKEDLERSADATLRDVVVAPIGRAARTGADTVFAALPAAARRRGLDTAWLRPLIAGESVRDWAAKTDREVLFPYDAGLFARSSEELRVSRYLPLLWPWRPMLAARKTFQGRMADAGLAWFEFMQYTASANRTPLSIAFAFVATHNHFVLDRGGKVFKQTAPIIKLPAEATEEDHLALLGYLNSSAACFWMKQVMHDKGHGSDRGKWQSNPAKVAFEFAGTLLGQIPLHGLTGPTRSRIVACADLLDRLAAKRAALERELPSGLHPGGIAAAVAAAIEEDQVLLERQIHVQEELDWAVYCAAGLVPAELAQGPLDGRIPLGGRPFEVLAATRGASTGLDGQRLSPSLPAGPALWHRRMSVCHENASLRVIEQPENKRRWVSTPKSLGGKVDSLELRVPGALRGWLLDRLEAWVEGDVRTRSVREAAYALGAEPKVEAVAAYLTGTDAPDLAALFTELVGGDGVPHAAALRFRESGLEKHARWQATWALQRREDAGEAVGDIPVPPKYGSKDYARAEYWRLRGKLDVPKERFVLYPGAERDEDRSVVLGWAGWDALERARALAGLYQERKTRDGWEAERLVPLLVGLDELVPWLLQWHDEPDAAWGGQRMGQYFDGFVEGQCRELGLARGELATWRPARRTRR